MPVLGGALAYARIETETDRTEALLRDLTARIAAAPRITTMTEATATGCFADNLLSVMQGDRLIKRRAGSLVVATGAIAQPMGIGGAACREMASQSGVISVGVVSLNQNITHKVTTNITHNQN